VTHEEIFEKAERAAEDGAFSRIDETHPVGLFLGVENRCRALMIVCPRQPPDLPSLAAIRVEARQRGPGQWALVLRLERPELKALFTRLVDDLEEATRALPSDPGEIVVRRLARWQRLLSRRPSDVLEDHVLRGLAAELAFLLDEAIPAVGPDAALSAWVGPWDAPKDFAFSFAEVEVKGVHRLSREVGISSLEQLTDAARPIYLWLKPVEMVPAADPHGVSLMSIVARARSVVVAHAEAAERLEDALRAAGFEDRPEYLDRIIRFWPATCLAVRGTFPRVQRPDVSAGVIACAYRLGVRDLDAFIVPTWRQGNGGRE
jgi:hypothetical protein